MQGKINREKVMETFRKYTECYDTSDEKIKLKIDHTYRVAGLCERIAASEHMSQQEQDLAWLLGMLHDVGRFEQLREYGTFIDSESIDHAALGADILFSNHSSLGGAALEHGGIITDYVNLSEETELIECAVRVHSAYRIPENLSARTEIFCNILRDADKIDILKVNAEIPLEEIYNTTSEELYSSKVTETVMESFFAHHAVLRSLKRTSVDHVIGHCSLVYELVFSESLRIVKEQGYLYKLLQFPSKNKKTREQFAVLRAEMERYLQEG